MKTRGRGGRWFPIYSFQFPSNGKAHENQTQTRGDQTVARRFNSLQTGKRMKTRVYDGVLRSGIAGFNSLQTGKRMKTRIQELERQEGGWVVSIPFKRESA